MFYELTYLLKSQLEEKDQANEIKSVQTAIKEQGGEIVDEQPPEGRTLGYPIAKMRRGIMGAQVFTLENPAKISAITAKLNLSERIVRLMVIKHKQKPNPAAMKAVLSAVIVRKGAAEMKPARVSVAAAVAAGVPEAVASGAAKKAVHKRVLRPAGAVAAKKKSAIKDIDDTISEIVSDKIKV